MNTQRILPFLALLLLLAVAAPALATVTVTVAMPANNANAPSDNTPGSGTAVNWAAKSARGCPVIPIVCQLPPTNSQKSLGLVPTVGGL